MITKGRASGIAAGLIAVALSSSPAFAQIMLPAPVTNPAVTTPAVTNPAVSPAQITSFSRAVGLNETCTRAFLVATGGHFPTGLTDLDQFITLAPAADLCTPAAIANANTPTPTPVQIAAFAQTVGVNQACIQAFVTHDNGLPTSQTELNQFQLAAPLSALCTQAAVASAQH